MSARRRDKIQERILKTNEARKTIMFEVENSQEILALG